MTAAEVFRVPRSVQGRQTFVDNWSVARSTGRRKQKMVVAFAVRLAVSLEEIARSNRLSAMYAHEVLRVPEPGKGSYHLSNNRLGTGGTMTLRYRHDTLSRHVAIQFFHHLL